MTKLEKWTHVSEIVAALGVIITLLVLVQEVRTNTTALRLQADVQSVSAATTPFLSPESVPLLYAKVKAVDGLDEIGPTAAYVERYGMTTAEAIQWERLAMLTWFSPQQTFQSAGPSAELEGMILGFMTRPDLETYARTWILRIGGPFADYIEEVTSR